MTNNKENSFDMYLNDLANWAKAMSHPARLQIMQHLAQNHSCTTADICKTIPLSRTTIAQHMQELKTCKFVKTHQEGNKVFYLINKKQIKKCRKKFKKYFEELNFVIDVNNQYQ